MAEVEKALDRMKSISARWFAEDPMLLNIWVLVEKVPSKDQTTIGIDARSRPAQIKFNPNFINALSGEQLEAVMVSNAMKLLLRHPSTRLKNPREISSLASTITVDELSMVDLIQQLGLRDIAPLAKTFDLPEKSYFEEYYRLLFDKLADEKHQNKLQKMYQKSDKKDDEKGKSPKDKTKDDANDPFEIEDSSKDEDGYTTFDDSKEALKEFFNPFGNADKDWDTNDVMDAEIKNLVDEKKGQSKSWGKHTGKALAEIVAANTPKIGYKEIIRRFKTSVTTTKQFSTRMKPNRRFDLDVPGRKRIETTHIIFAIDVSGSMSNEDIAEGFAVINSVCRNAKIEYVTFDTEIKDIETKMKKAKQRFKISGRGGTDPSCVIEYAKTHKADGLVIYSDMGFSSNIPEPKMKVLWLGHTKGAKPPVKWGYSATLNRFE